uniref:Uncharacterized protein n=1 Tax=Arcella intermedia TaxID=1963864 RepID=A0A6B2LWV2_9EUKA
MYYLKSVLFLQNLILKTIRLDLKD